MEGQQDRAQVTARGTGPQDIVNPGSEIKSLKQGWASLSFPLVPLSTHPVPGKP